MAASDPRADSPAGPAEDAGDIEVREYRAGDEHQILDLFNRVFAAIDPAFVPRTLQAWRWQYLENPSGWRIWLAFTRDGRLISQYAGVGQRVLLEGAPAKFSQAVDSMTDRSFARGLKKPGYFVLTGYPYAANYGGPPPHKDVIMWGAPVPPAWRIGRAYLEYEMIRPQQKLSAPPVEVRARRAPGVEIEEPQRFPEEVEALFRCAAAPHGAIAVRDKAQLDWRFCAHPERRYALALARRGGELRGLTVYSQGAFDGQADQGLVCDWLAVPGDEEVAHALRAWLVERARADGVERLVAAFPDTCAEWLDFQRAGLRVASTRHFLVGRNYVRGITMRWLHRRWYYTLGDTDLV